MKVLFVTLLCVAAAFGAAVQQGTMAEGPRCPIADPLIVAEGRLNITLTDPVLVIDLGSTHNGGEATGLSTLYYFIEINAITLTAKFEATVSAKIVGKGYTATGSINVAPFSDAVFPSGKFVAGGNAYFGSIEGGHIKGSASLLINVIGNKVSCYSLTLETLTFNKVELNLENFKVGDLDVDFASWNENFKANFDREYALVGKSFIDIVRTKIINTYLARYTLAELIELIGDGNGTSAPCATTPSSIE